MAAAMPASSAEHKAQLKAWMMQRMRQHDFNYPMWIATDGGSKNYCSSWAIATSSTDSLGGPIRGEDWTPLTAELVAALVAIQAIYILSGRKP